MAWNIELILYMVGALLAFYLGIFTERGAWRESNRALRKETRRLYREIENLREIIYYYENRPIRQGDSSAQGQR